MTFAHFAVSALMCDANCSGVLVLGSKSSLDSRSRTAGSLRIVVIPALSLTMIAADVPADRTPNHGLTSAQQSRFGYCWQIRRQRRAFAPVTTSAQLPLFVRQNHRNAAGREMHLPLIASVTAPTIRNVDDLHRPYFEQLRRKMRSSADTSRPRPTPQAVTECNEFPDRFRGNRRVRDQIFCAEAIRLTGAKSFSIVAKLL